MILRLKELRVLKKLEWKLVVTLVEYALFFHYLVFLLLKVSHIIWFIINDLCPSKNILFIL